VTEETTLRTAAAMRDAMVTRIRPTPPRGFPDEFYDAHTDTEALAARGHVPRDEPPNFVKNIAIFHAGVF
jgi:hypothetical protein